MKRRYLVSTCVSSAVSIFTLSAVAPVAAADLNPMYKAPVAAISPAFNWNGFYVGANVGGAWASDSVSGSSLAGPFPTSSSFPKFESYQAALSSLKDQV
jgi:hypothetical protein